ncbi:P-loop containing nucleoside triphosphate hydrolase protein [Gaertneriomyces semiglobifer]|nr:P-loop containing nucleoside triphosphate hydrolase protein [Gaertneriomyces semiglobifer]
MEIVTYPLRYPRLIAKLNVEPPKGILLHGAPGVGKTMLVRTVAQSCGAKVIIIHGPEIFSPLFGESEERLRSAFREAVSLASSQSTPCILFIDEIDALAPRRDVSRPQENRIVAQLLTLMDGMESRGSLVVIGATNRPNAIDPALRRPGRFDREVTVDIPTAETRLAILKSLTSIMPLCEDVDLCQIAEATNGYVGADLAALCREAALDAINHSPEATAITQASFQHAMHICGASTQRDSVVRFSKTSWDEIGGLEDVKQSLRQMVEWPLKYQETYRRLRLKPPRGVLLYGPPGCSKTTLVKIIASSTGATFLSLSGATLYSPYVGDSEQAVRSIFQRARAGAPSIVFFDEIDAIVGKRAFDGSSGAQADTVQERVLSTLLNEMDGIELANDVLVVGATNRPDMIDAALMRPGRFDRVIYVPPPEESARKEILDLYTGKMALDTAVDNSALAGDRTERYTGADLKAVCREAAMEALRESREAQTVLPRHFDRALLVVKPTLSMQMLAQYQAFAEQFGTGVI